MKIFPTQMNQDFGINTETAKTLPAQSTELDQIIAQTSLSIIDDYPSADPRWAESKNASKFQLGVLILVVIVTLFQLLYSLTLFIYLLFCLVTLELQTKPFLQSVS